VNCTISMQSDGLHLLRPMHPMPPMRSMLFADHLQRLLLALLVAFPFVAPGSLVGVGVYALIYSLAALGLQEIRGRLIEDLSSGQKQRVAIAGALAMRPRFLILDEPTSLLPVPVAMRLVATIRDLNRRESMGVLHVTHSMHEASLFDRVLVMDSGRKILDGTPAEVFRHVERLREVGLDVPLAASLAHRLRARGFGLKGDILDEADLRISLSSVAGSPSTTDPSA